MSVQSRAAHGWLRVHQTSPQVIQGLLAMVDGDLETMCEKYGRVQH
ncbi:MAG TPA: hypothetical protein VEC99_04410 [Clostridia bacterium]|nr:hypothetical protein [Clostridia bacterium]